MQADLREFLAHLIGTIFATLIPVVLLVFAVMPMNFHHHIGTPVTVMDAVVPHMT